MCVNKKSHTLHTIVTYACGRLHQYQFKRGTCIRYLRTIYTKMNINISQTELQHFTRAHSVAAIGISGITARWTSFCLYLWAKDCSRDFKPWVLFLAPGMVMNTFSTLLQWWIPTVFSHWNLRVIIWKKQAYVNLQFLVLFWCGDTNFSPVSQFKDCILLQMKVEANPELQLWSNDVHNFKPSRCAYCECSTICIPHKSWNFSRWISCKI